MMDMVALHHCPYCGEEACAEMNYIEKAFRIYCSNCPAEMRVTYKEADLDDGSVIAFDEAINWMNTLTERWNERA